uniref:Putative ovule protein n=1 Tax=Solanum chacoense TaxID=4108 RepID=A0A0V0GHI8_SOLCH
MQYRSPPGNLVHPMIDLCLVSGTMPPLVKHASMLQQPTEATHSRSYSMEMLVTSQSKQFILKFPIHSLPDLHWATVASTASTNLKDLDTSAPGVCVPTMHIVVVGACWA